MPDAQEIVTLREYFERRLVDVQQRLDAYERSHMEIHKTQQVAIDKADMIMDVRLASMNEWRAAMGDALNTFVRREQLESSMVNTGNKLDAIDRRLNVLDRFSANMEGRITAVGVVASLAGIGVSIALHFIR